MKNKYRLLVTLIVAVLVSSCTTAQVNDYYARVQSCQNSGFRYAMSPTGDIIQVPPNCSHIQPGRDNSANGAAIAGLAGIGVLLAWLLVEYGDNKNADNIQPPLAPAPSNGLVVSGGTQTTTFTNDFIQPVFQPVQ